ncbi:GNAT family N-acetyltransferase [Rickettsia endosymbiont of Pantilius tunicatus]|uniref:GNAT family N-acetyltransferase n=1 Tax=unclassified Rickettsia TaxID=114295 RepID=UPI00376EC389
MNEINIRSATINDISSILPLMSQLGYPSSIEELTARFSNFINIDGYGVAVASLDNKIVGAIAWSKSILFVSDKTRIHVEALIIDENYREQKIGKKLMEYLEEIAKNYSPVIVDLTSGYRRAKDGTHAFYENIGYKCGESAGAYFRKELYI